MTIRFCFICCLLWISGEFECFPPFNPPYPGPDTSKREHQTSSKFCIASRIASIQTIQPSWTPRKLKAYRFSNRTWPGLSSCSARPRYRSSLSGKGSVRAAMSSRIRYLFCPMTLCVGQWDTFHPKSSQTSKCADTCDLQMYQCGTIWSSTNIQPANRSTGAKVARRKFSFIFTPWAPGGAPRATCWVDPLRFPDRHLQPYQVWAGWIDRRRHRSVPATCIRRNKCGEMKLYALLFYV